MLQIPRHQQPQRVHSAAARFRLPDFERSREQLELLQIGIDPQEEKLRQQDQKQQISSTPPSDALAAEPFLSAASPAAMMARRFEEVLANKNVKEVRRVLQERSQQRASTASAAGGASTSLRIGTRTERHTQEGEGNRKRLSTEPLTHHHLNDEAPPPTRPVTVGDIQRRRQENWGNSLADQSAPHRHGSHQNSSNTMAKQPDNTAVRRHVSSAMNYGGPTTMVNRAAHKLPPRGCTPTAADPLQLLEESIITSTTTAQMLHREDAHDHLPPRPSTSLARLSTHNSHQHPEDHNYTTGDDDHLVVKRIRRPQSVGGTWDHAMPNNYALSPALAATDDVNVVRRLLQDTQGVACSDITDLADDVFDLPERARTTQQQGEESSSDADSDSDDELVVREEDNGAVALQLRQDDETADPLYTHDDLMRMKLEIQRYELSEELARLVARRVALQQAKEQKVEERLAIRRLAEDNIRSYDENHKLIAGEMDAQWAAYRKKLDDERAAVRLRQLPVVNGVVRKKFLLPKFPSPWALIDVEKIPPPPSQSPPSNNNNITTYNVEDNEEYDSLMATAIVSPKTSRPGSSSANRTAGGQQQQQQDPPQWKRELEVSQQKQGPMRSQSATTIAKRKRAIDRKRLAALPEAQRQEVYAMRVAEFNRYVTRVEPDGRNEVVELEVRERAAMIALLEDGLVEESRQRRTLVGDEQKGCHSIFASAAGELRSLQTREWAPTVFADKKRQEQRAAAEVASPSERQAVLEAANESHRRNIRAVWDKTFELRAQLLTVQRQTLAKKDEIRFARNAVSELSALPKNAVPIPGVSITRTDVAATGAAQRLQILELQLDMLEEKQSELRKSIDVLQKTTW